MQDTPKNNALLNWLSKAFTLLLAFIPILSIYHSGLPGLNVADLLLLFAWVITVLLIVQRKVSIRELLAQYKMQHLVLFGFMLQCLALLAVCYVAKAQQFYDIAVRTTRIVFYFATILVLSPIYVDYALFIRFVKVMSLLGAFLLFVQIIVHSVSGTVIRGFVPFAPLYTPEYALADYELLYSAEQYRPTSFFLEPAHFSRYALFGLAALLFCSNKRTRGFELLGALVVTIAIVMSTSGIGLVLSGIVWLIFLIGFFKMRIRQSNHRIVGLVIVCLILMLATVYLTSSAVQYAVQRTFRTEPGSAFDARLGSAEIILMQQTNLWHIMLGRGYGAVPGPHIWMSDFVYVVFGTGLLGIGLVLISIVSTFFAKRNNPLGQVLPLLIALLMFVDDSFNSVIVVFLYTLMLYNTDCLLLIEECRFK